MSHYVNDTPNDRNSGSPRLVQSFTDYRHDNLTRCSVCKFKYDLTELRKLNTGIFVCKFCTKQNGVKNV